jgi:hypothetical protein
MAMAASVASRMSKSPACVPVGMPGFPPSEPVPAATKEIAITDPYGW